MSAIDVLVGKFLGNPVIEKLVLVLSEQPWKDEIKGACRAGGSLFLATRETLNPEMEESIMVHPGCPSDCYAIQDISFYPEDYVECDGLDLENTIRFIRDLLKRHIEKKL